MRTYSVTIFRRTFVALTLLVACLLSDRTSSGQDVFEGLGDLPGGANNSGGRALSPDGRRVAGFGVVSGLNDSRGFVWTNDTGMTQLGSIFNGRSAGLAVSNTGRVVGQSPGLFDDFATYWNADGSFGASLGDFDDGATGSAATDISADGSVIVGWGTGVNGRRPFRWTEATGMQDLGIPDRGGSALAVSNDGSTIVGEWATTLGEPEQAFRWRDGFLNVLGDLPGGIVESAANDVSADGSVVVGSSSSSLSQTGSSLNQAFRWTEAGGMEGLGYLGDAIRSEAEGVSADGSIVVGRSGEGFIWDPQQGMRSFREVLVQDLGIDLTGWSNFSLEDISADGLTITGRANSPDAPDFGFNGEAFRVSVDARWIRESNGDWNDRSMWAFGINPNELHDILVTPTNALTVTKSTGHSTIRSLRLNANNGLATLDLAGGNLTVTESTTILANGRLTGSSTINALGGILNSGIIELTGGQVTGGDLINFNRVGGDGIIASRLLNTATGQVRVGSDQHLHLTGLTAANDGLIDVVGGTFEVSRSYINGGIENNSALIFARDAALRFNGGLRNFASLGSSFGTSDIYGDVENSAFGRINISGGANVTFVDDLQQNGVMEVVRVGTRASSAVIFGEFSGAGGFEGGGDVFALGDLRPGNSPASVLMDGNLYLGNSTHTHIELAGLEQDEFDQLVITGDFGLAGELSVDLIDGFLLAANQEFLIANVTGSLFGQFDGLAEGDLVGNFGRDLFISYRAGDGNDISLFSGSAIPEPASTSLLFILALVGLRRRRSI